MEYTLTAVKYNNYYNRVVKTDAYTDTNPYIEEGVYFNPGDGVNTSVVLDDLLPEKDYIFAVSDEGDESHWFILDCRYQLNGQVSVTLRRDLMRDFLPSILYAKAYVEKGYLEASNNLIFNSEGMSFNQVKKEEILLKDSTNCPWIIGYYPNNAKIEGDAKLANSQYDVTTTYTFAQIKSTVQRASGIIKGRPYNQEYTAYFQNYASPDKLKVVLKDDVMVQVEVEESSSTPDDIRFAAIQPNQTVKSLIKQMKVSLIQNYGVFNAEFLKFTAVQEVVSVYDLFSSWNGKRVLFADGKIGRITCSYNGTATDHTLTATVGLSLESAYKKVYTDKGITITPSQPSQTVYPYLTATATFSNYAVSLTELSTGSYHYSFTDDHYTLQDAPYSMFCMPYGKITVNTSSGAFVTGQDIAMAVATNIAETSGNVYDIQILPYCPIGEVNLSYTPTDSRAYDFITETVEDTTQFVGIIIHCQSSSFSKRISILNNVSGGVPSWLQEKSDPIEVKVQDQCEMVRFNSPNYAASWEMSVAKNKGVSYIDVSATYLPYNPYIKIAPDFKGLYGSDFNDNRGLILQGDFSIPIVTDAWKTYQLQNKNYENIFNREIKNLEIQQSFSRTQDIVGGITGATNAAGVGYALLGGITSAVGGIASAGAGIADYFINEQLRDEAKSLKTDMYNMQLGNIKALPNTLSKTAAYTVDNKYFPFIEYYSATDIEKEAFRSKLKYNGCTIGAIGGMEEYIGGEDLCFIQGQLIRLEGMGDMHVVNQIAGELAKGVYIDGNITTGI